MKKLVTFAAAISMAASFNFILPTAANASNGNNGVTAECQTLGPFLGVSVGNCIQLLSANNNANAVCHLWQGPYWYLFFGYPYPFSSFGECVNALNVYFGKT
jgi:hypothetical protein